MRDWEVWNEKHVENLVEHGWAEDNPSKGKYLKWVLNRLEGDSVLDVGCGIGRLLYFLPEEMDYLGIDSSEPMLERARERFPNRRFVRGDVYNLEVFDRFDTVVALALLIHLPDSKPALEQMWGRAKKCLMFTVKIGAEEEVNRHESIKMADGSKSYFEGGKEIIFHTEDRSEFDEKVDSLPDVDGVEKWNDEEHWVYKVSRTGRKKH